MHNYEDRKGARGWTEREGEGEGLRGVAYI